MNRGIKLFRGDAAWGDTLWVLPWLVVHWVVGWGRWGLFGWDTAREILLPRRILFGEIPFRDFESIYGPVSYQLNAFFLRLFGDSIGVDRIVNGALLLVVVWLMARVGILCGLNRLGRMLLLGSYFTLFVFPPDIMRPGNFMMPFSQAGVWQVVILMGIVYFLLDGIRNARRSSSLLACLLCGVAPLMVRLDSFPGIAFLALASVFSMVIGSRRTEWGWALAGVGLGFFPLLVWWGWTTRFVPSDLLMQRISEIRYYVGAGQSGDFQLMPFARAATFGCFIVLLVWMAARWNSRWAIILAILATSAVSAIGAWRDTLYFQYVFILVFFGCGILLWRLWALVCEPNRDRWANLVLAVGSVLLTIRIISGGDGYYFPFLAPILLLSVIQAFADWKKKLNPEQGSRLGLGLAVCWCLGFGPMVLSTFQTYREPAIRYETRWGDVWISDRADRSETMHGYIWAADQIKALSAPNERIYSYSPNMPVYALAGRLPVEYDADGTLWKSEPENGVLHSFAEARMIEKLEQSNIRWIVRDNAWIPVRSFALTRRLNKEGKIPSVLYFGRQFAPEIGEWIGRHFEERAHWGGDITPGATPFRYGFVVLERRSTESAK